MKKNILLLLTATTFTLLFDETHAQTSPWLWAQNSVLSGANINNGARGWDVCTDVNGDVLVTGLFSSDTIAFGNIVLSNVLTAITTRINIFIVKYNASGNVIWAKSEGGTENDYGNSITTDATGNVFVTGYFLSPTITFGSTMLTNTLNVGSDFYLVKYDSAGNVLWAKNNGGNDNDAGTSVSTDANGNVIVSGSFRSDSITFGNTVLYNSGNTDMFVVKYDAAGNFKWAKKAGGSGYEDGYVDLDSKGNTIIAGYFNSPSIAFDTIVFTGTGNYNLFLTKYDSLGNTVWAKRSIGSDNGPRDICIDQNDNALVTGDYRGTAITIGSVVLTNSLSNTFDMLIAKYDSSGNVLWAKSSGTVDNETGYQISTDSTGSFYISGSFNSTASFGTIILTPPSGSCGLSSCDPMFIVKYDANGNALCGVALLSGGSVYNAVAADQFGNAYVTSSFKAIPFIVGNDTITIPAGNAMFVAKFSCTITGINELTSQQTINVYPNPFSNELTISDLQSVVQIIMYDVFGRKVLSQSNPTLNTTHLQNGIYFLEVVTEKGRMVKKVVKG